MKRTVFVVLCLLIIGNVHGQSSWLSNTTYSNIKVCSLFELGGEEVGALVADTLNKKVYISGQPYIKSSWLMDYMSMMIGWTVYNVIPSELYMIFNGKRVSLYECENMYNAIYTDKDVGIVIYAIDYMSNNGKGKRDTVVCLITGLKGVK